MFETAMLLELMEKLRNLCHQNSKDKGFWDEGETTISGLIVDGCMGEQQVSVKQKLKPWNFGEKIALIHSELSEMFEAWRCNKGESEKDIQIIAGGGKLTDDGHIATRRITAIEEEVADVFIRLMDLCGKLDIDVGQVVLAKMEYNSKRPYLHGGRRC